jgi:hypothetical protein
LYNPLDPELQSFDYVMCIETDIVMSAKIQLQSITAQIEG